MGLTRLGAVASALLFLAQDASAKHHHNGHLHRLSEARQLGRHVRGVEKRGAGGYSGQCQFPDDPDLVAVTPGMKNKGWAMAPDAECSPGKWCPYACVSGKVMTQWQPDSSYKVGSSINGGLYCDDNGKIQKPFEDLPYCVDGTGAVEAVNEAGGSLSFCQTVLPGYEGMIIPSVVASGSSTLLAIPDNSYWCETAAHYYINAPGIGVEGCVWGAKSDALGNWTPYVAGGNTDKQGRTFVKVGWNPVFFEESALMAQTPTFGVRITCDDDAGCNGLPCEIDPTKGGLNAVNGNSAPVSIQEGNSCVVTVPQGKKAKVVVFDTAPKSGSVDIDIGISIQSTDDKDEEKVKDKENEKEKEKEKEPDFETSATHTPEPSTTSALPTTSSTSLFSITEEAPSSSVEPSSTPVSVSSSVAPARPSITQAIFRETSSNGTNSQDDEPSDFEPTTESFASIASITSITSITSIASIASIASAHSPAEAPPTATEFQHGEGLGSRHRGSAAAGLLVAFVAMIYLF